MPQFASMTFYSFQDERRQFRPSSRFPFIRYISWALTLVHLGYINNLEQTCSGTSTAMHPCHVLTCVVLFQTVCTLPAKYPDGKSKHSTLCVGFVKINEQKMNIFLLIIIYNAVEEVIKNYVIVNKSERIRMSLQLLE